MRLAALAVITLASLAVAQSPQPPTKPSKPRAQVVDLTGSTITAERELPVMDFTVIPERPLFKNLLQVRGSFANELNRSVDAIR
jgi:hypothetical protein